MSHEGQSKTFCVLPWMHLATNASGSLRVCCNSTPGKNLILNDQNEPFRLHEDLIEEAWQSKTYKKIREQFLAGVRPPMCERCFREEDSGIMSVRERWNKKWYDPTQKYEINPEFKIKYVDIRLGNLCNLKCRMCNPYASNQWVKEWALISDPLSPSEEARLSNMTWPESQKTWENLFSIAEMVEEVYLTGGEPTLIRQQHKLLDHFISKSLSKNIKLKYNTNLTNVPFHLLERWEKFKVVQLNCSIDGFGNVSEYIRYPSKWNVIVDNLERVRQIKNVKIEFHCTVQIYNILKLSEFIDWAEKYNIKIYFNILNHPENLNIRCLPKKLKVLAKRSLSQHLQLDKISGMLTYMEQENWSHLWPSFIDYTKKLDQNRNQNILSVLPELQSYFLS